MEWNEKDLEKRLAYQNRITDAAEFEQWFYGDSCTNLPIEVEPIPPEWADVV
jgi:hypothetical protein